jgi:hypothetical protein
MKLILLILCCTLLSGCLWGAKGILTKPGGYYGCDRFEYNETANYRYPGWSKYNNYDIMRPQYKTQQYDHYGFK